MHWRAAGVVEHDQPDVGVCPIVGLSVGDGVGRRRQPEKCQHPNECHGQSCTHPPHPLTRSAAALGERHQL